MPINAARHLLNAMVERDGELKLPVDPRIIAKNIGVRILPDANLDADNISGELVFDAGVPAIKYNPNDSVTRQRFTIAHELGHFVLKHGHSFRDNKQNFSLYNFDEKEVAANKFAAELLMPARAVSILINKRNIKDAGKLCQIFDVSVAALRVRLKNLGFVS